MPATATRSRTPRPSQATASADEASASVCEYFARLAQAFGLPRSVGQIYGVLFLAPEPLTFADIMQRAAVSKASASTGLRILQQLRAILTVIVPGDRRTFFRPELSARRLVSGLLTGTVLSQLDDGDRLLEAAESAAPADDSLLAQRLASLRTWHTGARDFLPILGQLGLR